MTSATHQGGPQPGQQPSLEKIIPNPYEPRANSVPSAQRPGGHYATPRGRTPLQQHLDYFDLNKDGAITPFETFWALHYLRFAWEPFNSIICFWLTVAFHLMYAYRTQDGWVPDLRFIIWTRNADAMAHEGGSTEVYDSSGHYVPGLFEDLWRQYDPRGTGRLGLAQVLRLVWDHGAHNDIMGSASMGFQWLLTWWLFRDDAGQLRKADVRGLYDGTAFYRLADRSGNPWYGMAARRDAVEKHHMG